jgi:AP-1 complex subunit gamma-1
MQAMSNADIAAGATETQQMRVLAPAGVSAELREARRSIDVQAQIRLRMKVSFAKGGQSVSDQQDFSGFPADLTVAR